MTGKKAFKWNYFLSKLPWELLDCGFDNLAENTFKQCQKRFAPCPKTIGTFFSNNCFCSKNSKCEGEWNFDNYAEKKWGGRNIPAQCPKMIKKLTNDKETLSLTIFQGTCRMPSCHLRQKVVEVSSRQSSSSSQIDEGKNPFLTEKPLLFKTFHCTRRLRFWQLRLRKSDKKLKLFRSIKTKSYIYPWSDPMDTYNAVLTTPAHSFWH